MLSAGQLLRPTPMRYPVSRGMMGRSGIRRAKGIVPNGKAPILTPLLRQIERQPVPMLLHSYRNWSGNFVPESSEMVLTVSCVDTTIPFRSTSAVVDCPLTRGKE